jgi:DMSO reductase anchor subunit
MHPAYSVIFFTTLSGAGYGLLTWLALGRLSGEWIFGPWEGVISCLVGLALVTAGLLSSSLHLGHPERAWRAFSQWRTSWLSREGVVAVLTYPPALLFTAGWIPGLLPPNLMPVTALATAVMSLLTVICTGMIYASLRTIPRWHNAWVVPVYLAFSLASGGLLCMMALTGAGRLTTTSLLVVLVVLFLAWAVKWAYWGFIDGHKAASDTGTATGLGRFGRVSQLEAPHTSENYLLMEMGYRIARKHASRLRRIAFSLGLLVPTILILLAMNLGGLVRIVILSAALLAGYAGIVIERWLFFAEARHAVTLFYGREW